MRKLYLVDVSSMFFRAFYAIRPLSNPAGMPVNALYGFLSMTVKLLREIRPDYMAFCFDRKEASFRVEIDPNYKANRTDMPEDMVPQVPYMRTLSEALGIPCFDVPKYEADDIIGTLTKFGCENNLEVVIVSGDKDFAQLISPCVSMYDTMKDVRYDEAGAIEKWGVEPKKMIDYLAICGDSSDNVPGVAGIGPKGAQKLLADYGSLEGIYANLDKISSASTKKKLEESRDDAFLSQRLVTIVCDMALGVKLEDLKLKPIVRENLSQLLAELDFKTFARTLLGETPTGSSAAVSDPSESSVQSDAGGDIAAGGQGQGTARAAGLGESSGSGAHLGATARDEAGATVDVDGNSLPAFTRRAKPAFSDHHVPGSISAVLNPTGRETGTIAGGANEANSSIRRAPPQMPVVEIEKPTLGKITETRLDAGGLETWLKAGEETWAIHTERCSYLAQKDGSGYSIAEIATEGEELGRLITAKNLRFKGFDIKDFCKRHHVTGPQVVWDQMLAAYVVRAGAIDDSRPLFTLYNGEPLPDLPSASQLLTAHVTLEAQLRRKVTALGGERVLFEIEQPLVPLLLSMENAGILIDSELLKNQSDSLTRDIASLEREIHEEAGGAFGIGSTKQLGQILFEKMKMPTGRRTKTGYSTDNEVLQKLSKEFPFTSKILQWRELSKLKSTYVDALPAIANKETGRVHTTFNQANTATGRLSSVNPNLQNIPTRTERGNLIRKAFIASKGHTLVSADYSQIELRILAHITDDEGLLRAFETNADIHSATAAEVFDVPLADVTKDQRSRAKAVNFGLAYGLTAFGLAERLRIDKKEAGDIINRYFARFSGVKTYMVETIEEAKQKGYVETIFGRRRYIDELFSKSSQVRQFGERAAINAPIQGTASDLVKLAMIKVGTSDKAKMLLQVHDELVMEVDKKNKDESIAEITARMEDVAMLKVPLQVNVGSGHNWDDAHS